MRVIKPVQITEDLLISSSVAEPSGSDPAAWSNSVSYVVDDFVYVAATHRVYKCIANNTGTDPVVNSALPTPTAWTDYGPTNRWAMFDQEVNTQSTGDSPLSVVLQPGIVNAIALLELVGTQAVVTMRDELGGAVVYTRTAVLERSSVLDWSAYFFEPFQQLASLVLTDLPSYLNGAIYVDITGTGAPKCGALIVGRVYSLGGTEHGVQAGIRDYSRKEVDETTGVTSLQLGKFSKRMQARMCLESNAVNGVQSLLTSLRATPCVWIGDDSGAYDALVVFGFYRDFRLDVAYPTLTYCSLDIEGML